MTAVFDNRFKKVEERFEELKLSLKQGKISRQEFIDSLRQLRFRDDEGKFWMVGAQSGQWYYFDLENDDWVRSVPPVETGRKIVCPFCGFANDAGAEKCARCGAELSPSEDIPGQSRCPACGRLLEYPDADIQDGSQAAAGKIPKPVSGSRAEESSGIEEIRFINRFDPVSFFWFSSVSGIFIGLLLGLIVGVTDLFPGFVAALPQFFIDIQGKFPGGVIYPVVGAGLGFVFIGAAGFLAAAVSNLVLSLAGGIKIKTGSKSGGRSY